MDIAVFTVMLMPLFIRYLVLGVCFVRETKPEADGEHQGPQQYELPAIDGDDPPPPYSGSQSSTIAQIPEEMATTVAAEASTMPSHIADPDDPDVADTKPSPPIPSCKDYITLTACILFAIIDIMALFVLGFGFQSYLYCPSSEGERDNVSSQRNAVRALFLWIAFSFFVAWLSSDILCLRLMVKDMWDGQTRRQNADEQSRTLFGVFIFFAAVAFSMAIVFILVLLFIILFTACWDYTSRLFGFPQKERHGLFSRLEARRRSVRQSTEA